MAKDEEKGVYVGSGGFRIDRSKMLDQLSRFGYEYDNHAVAALVRCAVLGKATHVRIKGLAKETLTFKSYDGLEIEFDGKPIDEKSLRNPYDCLLADQPDRRRLSQLARALLTITRGKPNELTLTSGPLGARFELSVRSLTDDSIRRVDGSGSTVLRVSWEGYGGVQEALLRELSTLAHERMTLAPIPIEMTNIWTGVGDQSSRSDVHILPDATIAAESVAFQGNGFRGRVEMPARVSPTMGRIDLCWAGVQVERIQEAAFLPVPVDGFLDHDGFNLDLSGRAITRDEAFAAGVAALSREAIALAVGVAAEQARVMTEAVDSLRKPGRRGAWTRTLEGELENEPEEMEQRPLYHAAVRTRWLRYCALNAASLATSELTAALQAAPLFFSTALEPLSLGQLRATMDRLGRIPASPRLDASGSQTAPTLWLSSTRDAPLLPKTFLLKRLG